MPAGTYRAAYTVKYAEAVFVLHGLEKKSKRGIATAKSEYGHHSRSAARGRRMSIPQPKVSGNMRGDFTNLSERKLMDCLNCLGYAIEIIVRPAAEPVGYLTLAVA
ncbi:XRE family transcriptional regulator [Candidatus Accumulibacter sp. ACC003]|uniref:XRE family transcriptional regulator n=1 Tax=Candidatus Accumulibacter sp. ACC003 TaxID=2823334 RepID=UPI0025C6C90B|nr:XRE family transcriptional regulator [Candidatus Accumulibacter sp. ACC003]